MRALRDAGAVILGKTVTTEFAAVRTARHAQSETGAHTPGGSSSGSAASSPPASHRRARHAGHQLDRPPGELLRFRRLQADRQRAQPRRQPRYQSQSCTGVLGASLDDTWQVAHEIVARVGGDAGTPGLQGPDKCRRRKSQKRSPFSKPRAGKWASAAKQCLDDFVARLKSAGVDPHPARRQERRRARNRTPQSHGTLAPLQWLGKPLVPAHHARARRQQAQPHHPRTDRNTKI